MRLNFYIPNQYGHQERYLCQLTVFSQGYYNDAINDLERFLVKYKNHPQTDYAYYLLALSHYDQIIDEKKDMNEILKAKEYFEIIIGDFPNTEYAQDSKYKLEYIIEIMASKEMYLARYYIQRKMDTCYK